MMKHIGKEGRGSCSPGKPPLPGSEGIILTTTGREKQNLELKLKNPV
jgi:hypothetical protein